MEMGIYEHCCKALPFSRVLSDQHWLAARNQAFLPRQHCKLCCKTNHPISQMARHISAACSGCQEEESRDPTECFCSSDEAALRRLSWLQHQRRGAGSRCCARSTGRSEPGDQALSVLAAPVCTRAPGTPLMLPCQ